jgi:hypothetical protein
MRTDFDGQQLVAIPVLPVVQALVSPFIIPNGVHAGVPAIAIQMHRSARHRIGDEVAHEALDLAHEKNARHVFVSGFDRMDGGLHLLVARLQYDRGSLQLMAHVDALCMGDGLRSFDHVRLTINPDFRHSPAPSAGTLHAADEIIARIQTVESLTTLAELLDFSMLRPGAVVSLEPLPDGGDHGRYVALVESCKAAAFAHGWRMLAYVPRTMGVDGAALVARFGERPS